MIRELLFLLASLGAFLFVSCESSSELSVWPNRTITIICPWDQGGGTDRNARFWASALEKKLGKRVIVVNRTGARGVTGHSAGASAQPDGYTLTMITAELSTMNILGLSEMSAKDFDLIAQVNADPAAIVVHKDAPWQNLNELLQAIKSGEKKLRMTGTATTGTWDLARAHLLHTAGIPVEQVIWVPSDGASPSLQKLLGKHVDAICVSVPEVDAVLKSGEVRVLAVMSTERLQTYADIPTAKEQGVDCVSVGWRGLAAPKGVPTEVLQKLRTACDEILAGEEYREFMAKNRFGVAIRNASEFETFLAQQEKEWKPILDAAGYTKGAQ